MQIHTRKAFVNPRINGHVMDRRDMLRATGAAAVAGNSLSDVMGLGRRKEKAEGSLLLAVSRF